jgi:hypothetical protein
MKTASKHPGTKPDTLAIMKLRSPTSSGSHPFRMFGRPHLIQFLQIVGQTGSALMTTRGRWRRIVAPLADLRRRIGTLSAY